MTSLGVLFVDDDAVGLARVVRALAPEARCIIAVSDRRAARQVLDESAFDLVIWALRSLADAPGPIGSRGLVIGVAPQLHVDGLGLPPTAVALPLPWNADALLAHVRRMAAVGRSLPLPFTPVEIVQMTAESGESRSLSVHVDGREVGVIEMRDGAVWSARDDLGEGEGAFRRMVAPNARARVRRAGVLAERTIDRPVMSLLLDALRERDEAQRDRDAAEVRQRQIRDLLADARTCLVAREYAEAAAKFSQVVELDPHSTLARANLEQLRKLGYET